MRASRHDNTWRRTPPRRVSAKAKSPAGLSENPTASFREEEEGLLTAIVPTTDGITMFDLFGYETFVRRYSMIFLRPSRRSRRDWSSKMAELRHVPFEDEAHRKDLAKQLWALLRQCRKYHHEEWAQKCKNFMQHKRMAGFRLSSRAHAVQKGGRKK
eukprot:4143833-Amphidinium_carterae.1